MVIDGIISSNFQGMTQLTQSDKLPRENPLLAQEFKAVFLQSSLKSERMEQHFITTNPVSSNKEQNFPPLFISCPATLSLTNDQSVTNSLPKRFQLVFDTVEKMPTQTPPTKSVNTNAFMQSIWPYAKKAANLLGVDPKLLLAQVALETGWGKFVARDGEGNTSNNLFNIKANAKGANEFVQAKTTEYMDGSVINITASFKKYPFVEESFNDYVSLIKGNERYATVLAHANDPTRYANELYHAGYATDPNYADKILAIYNGNELQQF